MLGLLVLAASATQPLLEDVGSIANVCRSASEASDASGKAADWKSYIDAAAEKAKLDVEGRRTLYRMCGVYASARRDAELDHIKELSKSLDENAQHILNDANR